MGAISKLLKAGAKKTGLIKTRTVEVVKPLTLDNLADAKTSRSVAAKKLAEMKKEDLPEAVILKAKNDLRKAEAAIRKFSGKSSMTPSSALGGKKRPMAHKVDKPFKRKIKSQAVKKDFVKSGVNK